MLDRLIGGIAVAVTASLFLAACGVPAEDSAEEALDAVADVTPLLPSPWVADMVAFSEITEEGLLGKTELIVIDASVQPARGEEELINMCIETSNAVEKCPLDQRSSVELEDLSRFSETPSLVLVYCISSSCDEQTLERFSEDWSK